jgi:hypothetical protein
MTQGGGGRESQRGIGGRGREAAVDSLVGIPKHRVQGSCVRTLNKVLLFNCESKLFDHMFQLLPTQLTAIISQRNGRRRRREGWGANLNGFRVSIVNWGSTGNTRI